MSILQTIVNAWKVADLRKKVLFTAFIIVLFRIGANIPVPFINASAIQYFFDTNASAGLLGYLNMLSGNALATGTVFALTIQPYINASIIVQLLAIAIPYFERLQKEGGEEGKKKLNAITRYLTIAIGVIQAVGYYVTLKQYQALEAFTGFSNVLSIGVIVITLVAGSMLVMWLGECIDERGIGNGISMILFASIVARGPDFVSYLISAKWYVSVIIVVLAVVMFGLIVFVDNAERRIPVQYAKRQMGRRMYGGQNTHLPIKVAMTGVMPIIFASSIVSLVPTILAFCGVSEKNFWVRFFAADGVFYPVALFVLIIAFSYFYTQITFDPIEVSNRIKSQGGTIAGIRHGKPTSDFIKSVLNKVTLVGALFLGVIAVLPVVAGPHLIQHVLTWFNSGINVGTWQINVSQLTSTFTFGGTTLLILVGVVLETFRELEAQLTMRNYKGFL